MAAILDLEIPRNGDFVTELRLTATDGTPIDLTGHTLESSARVIAGDGAVVASATVTATEATDGRFSLLWHGGDFASFGALTQVARFAYDFTHTYPDGLRLVPFRGLLSLIPEATP